MENISQKKLDNNINSSNMVRSGILRRERSLYISYANNNNNNDVNNKSYRINSKIAKRTGKKKDISLLLKG